MMDAKDLNGSDNLPSITPCQEVRELNDAISDLIEALHTIDHPRRGEAWDLLLTWMKNDD